MIRASQAFYLTRRKIKFTDLIIRTKYCEDREWFWASLLAGVLLLYDSWSSYDGIFRKGAPFQVRRSNKFFNLLKLKECFAYLLKAEQKQADKLWRDALVKRDLGWLLDGMFCKSLMFCSRNYKDSASFGIKKMLKKFE